jgi:hypothetical protein
MYVCVCVCVLVCVCMWVYVYMYACVCLWLCVVVCACVRVRVYVCMRVSACVCVYVFDQLFLTVQFLILSVYFFQNKIYFAARQTSHFFIDGPHFQPLSTHFKCFKISFYLDASLFFNYHCISEIKIIPSSKLNLCRIYIFCEI